MDVVSDNKIHRLVAAQGTTRIYELDDGSWLQASGGTVAWRNNNPGNLKFEFSGSADKTVHTSRSREQALARAQHDYKGVVDLDQWGNAIFESMEAGRIAQQTLLLRRLGDKTVEELVTKYSTADYSGQTHHSSQVATIHAVAEAQGHNLHGKAVNKMTPGELDALSDGISKAEGWKSGIVESIPSQSPEQLADRLRMHSGHDSPHPVPDHLPVLKRGSHGEAVGELQAGLSRLGYTDSDGKSLVSDGRFGAQTEAAVAAFQKAHDLHVDGVAGDRTLEALQTARRMAADGYAARAPLLDDARHPAHHIFEQARVGVQRLDEQHGCLPGDHSANLAGSLASAAVQAGMSRIDQVSLNRDASRAFAVQGEMRSPFRMYAEVDLLQAIGTPLSRSSVDAFRSLEQTGQTHGLQQQEQQPMSQESTSLPGLRM